MTRAVAAFLAGALLAAAGGADAQLYRWRDPQSGSVKLSSLPPPWFDRGTTQGPPVEVLVGGKVADPAALSRKTGAAVQPTGPLPPPRVAVQPSDASREQLLEAVVGGLRLREQFSQWSTGVTLGLDQAMNEQQAPDSVRDVIRAAARAAYDADRLYAHFLKAFSPELTDVDLRDLIDAEQTPIARRVAGVEASRVQRAAFDPQALVAAEARASPSRRALAEELERAVQGAELMASTVAAASAAFALNSPEAQRARIAEGAQRRKAELQPTLRRLFIQSILLTYEPLSDAELRALLELQRRPAVARANRAVALGLAAAVQGSLGEFIAAVQPVVASLRR